MTTPNVRRRRIWPWAIVALLVVVVVVVVVGFAATSRQTTSPSEPSTSTPEQAQVDGCLGGAQRDASTVLEAQESASHSTEGAVSYAATFSRWIYQIPLPEDVSEVSEANSLPDAVWAAYQQSAQGWSGPTPLEATTLTGRYQVIEESENLVQVTLALPWVVDGAVSPTRRFVPTLTLEWVGGRWEVTAANGDGADVSDLADLGEEIQGGC